MNSNERIDTSDIKIPSSPQFKLRNPQRKTMFVVLINILADPEFSQKGEIVIKIGGNVVFFTKKTPIKNYSMFPIKLNEELLDQKYLEIFAWNGIDTNKIGFDFDISLADTPEQVQVSAIPLGKDVLNKVISRSEELFPFNIYTDKTQTALLKMDGQEHLLLTMSGSTIPPVVEQTPADTSSLTPTTGLLFDYTQTSNSFSVSSLPNVGSLGDIYDVFQVVDLGRSVPQKLNFTVDKQLTKVVKSVTHYDSCSDSLCDGGFQERHINQNKVVTFDVDESDDPTFTTGVTNIETGVSDVSNPLDTTKRYLRITEHITTTYMNEIGSNTGFQNNNGHGQADQDGNFTPVKTPSIFTNWLDTLSVGGQAEVSLEILGSGSQWFELVSSSELGLVTAGSKILVEIGDTLIKKHRIPSTQTNLRAKLTVTNSIQTGVSILKVG